MSLFLSIAAVTTALLLSWNCSSTDTGGEPDLSSVAAGGTNAETAASGGGPPNGPPKATMSEDEWQAAIAPRAGEHEVWTWGCETSLIAQDQRILPTVECHPVPGYDYQTNPVTECRLREYCQDATDCTARAGGRCEGAPSETASCVYASDLESCSSDEECTTRAGGLCSQVALHDWKCFPSGRCTAPGRYCYYPEESCSTDADCSAAPNGVCLKALRYTACRYDDCTEDAQCPLGERCGCFACVPAGCESDEACPQDQSCQLEVICDHPQGYHCAEKREDCVPGQECIYEGEHPVDGICGR